MRPLRPSDEEESGTTKNTPRLNVICQSPGSIQRADGTEPTRTIVNSAPAPAAGQELLDGHADHHRRPSLDVSLYRRRNRLDGDQSQAERIAVETQIARYTGMRFAGSWAVTKPPVPLPPTAGDLPPVAAFTQSCGAVAAKLSTARHLPADAADVSKCFVQVVHLYNSLYNAK